MKSNTQPGYALATILILLGVAIFSIGALVTVSGLESKVSVSQREGIDAYYVAEAGVDDALWRLKTNDAICNGGCATQLQNGSLNTTYTYANTPHAGQSFTVTMASTSGQPAGTATITVIGYAPLTGGGTAQRQIISSAYLGSGSATPTTGTSAIFAGGNFIINSGAPHVTISGGNVYGSGGVSMNNGTVNIGTNCFQSQGNYVNNGTTISTGSSNPPCINAANYQPTPSAYSLPGFSFSYYASNNNASYNEGSTSTSFDTAVANGGSTVTFPGPVTYINGSMNISSQYFASKTVNVTGMLVINGSLNVNSFSGNTAPTFNFTDPGTGKSGLFVAGTVNWNDGTINDNGIFYTPSTFNINSTKGFTVNGGVLTGGSFTINSGLAATITYNASRIANSFGQGTPSVLQVKHWEEEY